MDDRSARFQRRDSGSEVIESSAKDFGSVPENVGAADEVVADGNDRVELAHGDFVGHAVDLPTAEVRSGHDLAAQFLDSHLEAVRFGRAWRERVLGQFGILP